MNSPSRLPRISAVWAGVVLGLLTVLAGSFWGVTPPPAYGICVACHSRDLVSSLANGLFPDLWLEVSGAGKQGLLLTSVGIAMGGYIAARAAGEWRHRAASRPLRQFTLGMLVMIFSMLAMGCTLRLLLLAAWGEPRAWWALGGAALGVVLATRILAWRARR